MASATQHYQYAPITEAIIDLRVTPGEGVALDQLRRLASDAADDFLTVERTFEAMGMLQVQPGVSAAASARQKQTGFKFTDADKKHVLQRRFDGFTFSRLTPYESWRPFRDKAKKLWTDYRVTAEPQSITRLAVWYINRIDIPETVELRGYFRTSPDFSSDLPQQLAGFFMQLQFQLTEIESELLINQTIASPAREGVVSVILDLDLFRTDNVMQDESQI